MGKAQMQQLFSNLEQADKNIKEEYQIIDQEKDADVKKAFYQKVASLESKVPAMIEVWKNLGMEAENQ